MPEAIAGADFSVQQLASSLTLEGLTQPTADGRSVPKLAESFHWTDDGRTLNVGLRRGVTFHDGTALTAELAAEVLNELIKRPSNQDLYPSLRDVIKVAPSGDLQIVIELSRRSAFLVDDLMMPLSVGNPAVGTGAYRVVQRSPEEIVLGRHDGYHSGEAQISGVSIRAFGALRNAWAGLLRGEVDMVTEVPPDALDFVQGQEVEVLSFDRPYQYVVAFNSRHRPLNSPAVRRALNLAINREALIRNVLQDRGTPATGPIWPQHWAYDRNLTGFTYDPALASSLLDAAGFRAQKDATGRMSRMRFSCLIPANFAVSERIGLEIQKQLYDIGVDLQFEVVPPEELDGRLRSGQFDAFLLDMISGPTLGRSYVFWASANAFSGLNLFGYENAEAERLYRVSSDTTNEAAVRSATLNLQRVFLNDPPALFLAWNRRSRAVRRDFRVVQDANDSFDPIHTIWKWTHSSPAE
ncbi:MAG: ABC transporter substrate-binding protein [Vicinamibacterales bacterium]